MSVITFDNARFINEAADQARTANIDISKVDHVRWLIGYKLFSFVGTGMAVSLPADIIAEKFNQAGIGVYVLTDSEKYDGPVIVPIAKILKTGKWGDGTAIRLERAELLVREKAADFKPWDGTKPTGP